MTKILFLSDDKYWECKEMDQKRALQIMHRKEGVVLDFSLIHRLENFVEHFGSKFHISNRKGLEAELQVKYLKRGNETSPSGLRKHFCDLQNAPSFTFKIKTLYYFQQKCGY